MAAKATNQPPYVMAAAAEAARLAAAHSMDARQRPRQDGGYDVALMDGARMAVYRVTADGSSTLCETFPRVSRSTWGRRMMVAAAVLFVAALVLPIPVESAGAAAAVVLIVGFFVGSNVRIHDGLRGAGWPADEWEEVPQLDGPALETSEQLHAAEAIAARLDGHAFVRRLPDKTAEVVATAGGRLYRYIVGSGGETMLVERSAVGFRAHVGHVLLVIAGLSVVAGLISVFIPDRQRERLVPLVFLGVFASGVVGAILCADGRASQLARPRDAWLEIRFSRED